MKDPSKSESESSRNEEPPSSAKYGYSHMARAREEKRREENDNPPVTHQIHPRTPFKTLRLYIPERDVEIVKVFKNAMERDGSSASAWVLERVHEWYKGHAPGNPQTALDRFKEMDESELTRVQAQFGGRIMGPEEDPENEERWTSLWTMTNEELLERSQRIMLWPNVLLERTEISLILLHRRLKGKLA